MDALTAFGLFAVSAMLACYTLERRHTLFILGFAASCALGSAYGFMQGAWPFGLVEAIWAVVAARRWMADRHGGSGGPSSAMVVAADSRPPWWSRQTVVRHGGSGGPSSAMVVAADRRPLYDRGKGSSP